MHRHATLLLLLLALTGPLLACNFGSNALEPTVALTAAEVTLTAPVTAGETAQPPTSTPAAPATLAPTATSPATEAAAPTMPPEINASPAIPATLPPTVAPIPGVLQLDGPEIAYGGVHFTLPAELARSVFVDTNNTTPGDVTFSLNPDGGCYPSYCLNVSPAASFEGTMAAHLPGELQAALDNGLTSTMPSVGAVTISEAHVQPLSFIDGSGFRAVSAAVQAMALTNNELLRYVFLGLTKDRQYLVSLYYEIDAPNLLSSGDPAQNTNENAFDKAEWFDWQNADPQRVQDYNDEASWQLQGLAQDAFTPGLALLDALVASLVVAGE